MSTATSTTPVTVRQIINHIHRLHKGVVARIGGPVFGNDESIDVSVHGKVYTLVVLPETIVFFDEFPRTRKGVEDAVDRIWFVHTS